MISKFFCWIGWHWIVLTGVDDTDFNNVILNGYCKHCGKKGMIDSQGNLFLFFPILNMYNENIGKGTTQAGFPLGQSRPISILERMVQREEKAHQHSAALDNHADRLRRIENALGLDPLPEQDLPMPPMQSFNY